jgi:formate dehydrogenase iron-sulfur subunit
MKRRNFFKLAGAAGLTVIGKKSAQAQETPGHTEFIGVLVDTTRCIGCRSCEVACARVHGLPIPDVQEDGALARVRTTDETRLTVVNRYETDKGEVFVKKQCMHCWQPACTSACLTNAMYKTETGPVIWRSRKCMGCRFCMVSCPYDIPKFEYHSTNPRIQKCDMCWERLQAGKKPACVEACPTDALMFGLKRQLMEVARVRVYRHPQHYVHKIYGESDVGGTGWLYLSAAPFEQIGLRMDLGTTPYPEYTTEFLYVDPVILFALPAFLMGLNLLVRSKEEMSSK